MMDAASDLMIFLEVTNKNSNNPFNVIPASSIVIPAKAGTQ